ncbi:MAG: hypothetical protein R3A52_05700 [Polyangiales bacterium]
MRRTILTASLFAATALVAAPASAQTVSRAVMVEALSAWESEPSPAAVRAWGDGAPEALIALAESDDLDAHAQVRAVHALRAFAGSARAHAWLRAVASRRPVGLFFLRAALDTLIEGFDDVDAVAPRLSRPRPRRARRGRVGSLSLPSARARAAVEARLAVEGDANVERTLSRSRAPPRACGESLPRGAGHAPPPFLHEGAITITSSSSAGRLPR